MTINASIIQFICLKKHHKLTGKTRHFLGDKELSNPTSLKIIKYPDDPGYYLLYFDENDNELTDTYHDTLSGALEQAEWEFEIKPIEWEILQQNSCTHSHPPVGGQETCA
jgi:hypothetical protein